MQKKREEEKRKMEYDSYRLKAQLYKTVGVLVKYLYSNIAEFVSSWGHKRDSNTYYTLILWYDFAASRWLGYINI